MRDDLSTEERNVAIKIIPNDKKNRKFAEREKKLLLRLLPHDNVIQYLAAVSHCYQDCGFNCFSL